MKSETNSAIDRTMTLSGLALIAIAAVLLVFVSGTTPLAVLAAIVGLALLLAVLARKLRAVLQSDHDNETGSLEVRLLVQSMAAMAVTDNKIAPEEIAAIARIYAESTGLTISPADIRLILADFNADFDIESRLSAHRAKLSPQFRRLIVKSCEQIMVSDEIATDEETAKLDAIRHSLRMN